MALEQQHGRCERLKGHCDVIRNPLRKPGFCMRIGDLTPTPPWLAICWCAGFRGGRVFVYLAGAAAVPI